MSHRQVLPDFGLVAEQRLPIARNHHLAAIHDGELVGQIPRELVILLHQHDGHVALRPQPLDGAADVLDDGRLVTMLLFSVDFVNMSCSTKFLVTP